MEERREIVYSDMSSASRRQPYDAMVYLEDGKVIAIDGNGKIIDKGTAGTDNSRVIQSATDLDQTTIVYVRGDHTLSAPIVLKSNFSFFFLRHADRGAWHYQSTNSPK